MNSGTPTLRVRLVPHQLEILVTEAEYVVHVFHETGDHITLYY